MASLPTFLTLPTLKDPKGRGTPIAKDLRAEKDRKGGRDRCYRYYIYYIYYRCDRGLRIDIIDGMGWIGGIGVKMGEW